MAILRLLGVVALLALTIAGFVMALRRGTFAWRRALRWTAALAVIPMAGVLLHWKLGLLALVLVLTALHAVVPYRRALSMTVLAVSVVIVLLGVELAH